MIKQVYCVHDVKSEAYLQPFFLDTDGQAIRAITDCVNDLNHPFGKHTSDYTLFKIGTYDDSNALFTQKMKSMGSLLEYKTQTEMDLNIKQLSLVQKES